MTIEIFLFWIVLVIFWSTLLVTTMNYIEYNFPKPYPVLWVALAWGWFTVGLSGSMFFVTVWLMP